MKRIQRFAMSVVAVAMLAGCGGGGGDEVIGSTSMASAEGFYSGSLAVTASPTQPTSPVLPNTSTAFQMLVLEGGQFWTIYGTPTSTSLNVEGFAQGTGSSNSGFFIAPNVRYFSANPATNAGLSARYNASAKSISGTITDTITTATFNSVALVQPAYNYATASALSAVQNNWKVKGVFGDVYDLAVNADGTFTGTPATTPPNPATCPFTGTFSLHPSGKNLFSVSIKNDVLGCALDVQNLQTNGIAFVSPVAGGQQLTIATLDSSRNRGAVISGVR